MLMHCSKSRSGGFLYVWLTEHTGEATQLEDPEDEQIGKTRSEEKAPLQAW